MCLAIPSKIIEITKDNRAICDTLGMRKEILLDLINEPLNIGDYVLIHVGYVIAILNEKEAIETLKMYDDILKLSDG
jgi:hydrogenase expression/formation protein HypC